MLKSVFNCLVVYKVILIQFYLHAYEGQIIL